MLTYQPDTTPSWSDSNVAGASTVTPKEIVAAVIKYYKNNQIDFTSNVYAVKVGYSVPYSLAGISQIESDRNADSAPAYNLQGQPVGSGYKGLIIRGGKLQFRK